MKNTKPFLIVSLIVHLLVFIILACVVLPPPGRFKEFLKSLSVDIVEVKPIVRKKPPVRAEAELEEKSEVPQSPKPPEPVAFSPSVEEPVSDRIRVASIGKTTSLRTLPEGKGMISVQPLDLRSISRPAKDKDIVIPPGVRQDWDGIADSSGAMGSSRFRVGSMGGEVGGRGLSTQYLYPFYPGTSPQRRSGTDEFAHILPALARGILQQATQKKMDIVFVIDTTGSMRDNVQGVKEYIHYFLEPIEEKGFDAALGLVEFTDLEAREAKVVGLTRNPKKFRKWLDKTKFFGGEDIPESGYEALIAALEGIDFRDSVQKFFIFISDASQHDLDYDGRSRYSLDRIIARLNDEGVRVDVVGANYLPMKQLARGTGGQWKHIPGGDPLMDVPYHTSSMIRSQLGRSLLPVLVEDKVTIEFINSVPD